MSKCPSLFATLLDTQRWMWQNRLIRYKEHTYTHVTNFIEICYALNSCFASMLFYTVVSAGFPITVKTNGLCTPAVNFINSPPACPRYHPLRYCSCKTRTYRKQIARQLRTQYVEGINNNPVTLKSRLRVTQGH